MKIKEALARRVLCNDFFNDFSHVFINNVFYFKEVLNFNRKIKFKHAQTNSTLLYRIESSLMQLLLVSAFATVFKQGELFQLCVQGRMKTALAISQVRHTKFVGLSSQCVIFIAQKILLDGYPKTRFVMYTINEYASMLVDAIIFDEIYEMFIYESNEFHLAGPPCRCFSFRAGSYNFDTYLSGTMTDITNDVVSLFGDDVAVSVNRDRVTLSFEK